MITIPIWLFSILLFLSLVAVLVVGIQMFVYLLVTREEKKYKKEECKRYGTYDDKE